MLIRWKRTPGRAIRRIPGTMECDAALRREANEMRSPLAAALLAGVLFTGGPRAQTDEIVRPDAVNPVERNAVEYRSERLQVVAAHYYFRGTHDPRWLLIDLGLRVLSGRPVSMARRDLSMVRPDGVQVELASQREYRRARSELLPLHVLLHTHSRNTVGLHIRVSCKNHHFRFFVDSGVRRSVVYAHRTGGCVRGDLSFASPTGVWNPGTYTLVVGGDVDVRLPIEIE